MKSDIDIIRNKELEYCKEHKEYFIENYVYIEDVDNKENILQKFKLWDKQKEVLDSIDKHRLNIILKARQLGVTWLVLAYSVYLLLFNPGYLIIALSKTEEDAKELIRRITVMLNKMSMFIKEDIEENKGWQGLKYNSTALSVEIKHKGKSSMFKAFSSSKGSGRSFTANVLILDEWAFQQFAREIWASAYPTINRPTGGKVIGLSTIDRGTLFEEIFTSDNDFNKVFMPWYSDPRRTNDWYNQTKNDLGDLITQEYPATIEEALTIPGGSFFPEFREDIHLTTDRTITNKYYAMDYGLDMLAVLEIGTSRNQFIVNDEIHISGLIASEAAKTCYDKGIRKIFAPKDLWDKNRHTGKSTADIFREHNIELIQVDSGFESGCLNIKEYLKPYEETDEQTGDTYLTAPMLINTRCNNLINSLKKIQKDKLRPNVYAKQPHELTHIIDALRYYAIGKRYEVVKSTDMDKLNIFKHDKMVEAIAGNINQLDDFLNY